MAFDPTDEQREALRLFQTGDDLVIEAGAGTGKTSTLRLISASTGRRGQYTAFNRAIVEEAKTKMPQNIHVATAHGLAARNTPRDLLARLRSGARMRSDHIARLIGVDPLVIADAPGGRRMLAAGFLAGVALQGVRRFCQSGDPEISRLHVPRIPTIDEPEKWDNNRIVAEHLLIPMRRIWADWNDPNGRLRYEHCAYLKAWQLTDPQLPVDFVLFDEAQDAAPVMRAIVAGQRNAQRIWVGDSQQQIYGFTGAINALAQVDGNRTFLTRSFRFGPEIAAVANTVLARLDAEMRIVGAGESGTVGHLPTCDVHLTRTNAAALRAVVDELGRGAVSGVGAPGKPYLLGGTTEFVSFIRAAQQLQETGKCYHPELACFGSWNEVRDYVEMDPAGDDLALWVDLIDEWGCDALTSALEDCGTPRNCTVTISTAHKSKGCEWDRVSLAGDYPTGVGRDGSQQPINPEDLRLMYVAATRARRGLNPGDNPVFAGV